MPCLLALIALVAPRLVIFLIWLMSDWFSGVFPAVFWPILGFIFLPTTLLWYTAVHHWYGGVWATWHIVVLVLALLMDVSPAGGRRSRRD